MTQNSQAKTEPSGKFEEALERLETIVAAMEKGELPLEETIRHYEEGMKLARLCAEKLGDAEKRIEILEARNQDGEAQWKPLQPDLGMDSE